MLSLLLKTLSQAGSPKITIVLQKRKFLNSSSNLGKCLVIILTGTGHLLNPHLVQTPMLLDRIIEDREKVWFAPRFHRKYEGKLGVTWCLSSELLHLSYQALGCLILILGLIAVHFLKHVSLDESSQDLYAHSSKEGPCYSCRYGLPL